MRKCTEFNSEDGMKDTFSYDQALPLRLKVENSMVHSRVVVEYDEVYHHVHASCGGDRKTIEMQVCPGTNEVELKIGKLGASVDEAANTIIEMLL